MNNLAKQINLFEDYSLDAQDGIMLEELLIISKNYEKAFQNLIKLNQRKADLEQNLNSNQETLFYQLEHSNGLLISNAQKNKEQIEILQLISILVMLLMILCP